MRFIDGELPWWAHQIVLCGNEGEGEGGGSGEGGQSGGTDSGTGGTGSEGEAGEGDDGDGEAGEADPADLEGLKSALRKERAGNKSNAKTVKDLQKQIAALQKIADEAADKDKSDLEKATKKAEREAEKTTKLATRLRTQAVDTLIERFAREMKFIDVDDALSGVDRKNIAVEQDDDDPSDIEVDLKTVKAAVKALADKKKHLIGEPGDGDPTGSKFGAGGGGKTKQTEEDLRKKYPALQ